MNPRSLPRLLALKALGLELVALLAAAVAVGCESRGSACANAGGTCTGTGASPCAKRAPDNAQDCNTNPPNPGGSFCCLAFPSDAEPSPDADATTDADADAESNPDAASESGACVVPIDGGPCTSSEVACQGVICCVGAWVCDPMTHSWQKEWLTCLPVQSCLDAQ
jgi:hypothetical protein